MFSIIVHCNTFKNAEINTRKFVPTKIVVMCGDGARMGTASAGMMRGWGQDFESCGDGDGDGVQFCGDGVGMGLRKFAQCGDANGLWTPCHSLV